MHPNNSIVAITNKHQIGVLLVLLAGLVIATFAPYGFVNFLKGLDKGDPFDLALLVSIMGIGFVLLHKLGFGLSYKEEIETVNQDPAQQQT